MVLLSVYIRAYYWDFKCKVVTNKGGVTFQNLNIMNIKNVL